MASHTATGEWKSFELRMRRRRAERLLLRAEAAMDAGFVDEARACVEEARRLDPNCPEIAVVQQRLDAPPVPMVASQGRRPTLGRNAVLAAAVAAAMVSAVMASRPSAPLPARELSQLSLHAPAVDGPPSTVASPAANATHQASAIHTGMPEPPPDPVPPLPERRDALAAVVPTLPPAAIEQPEKSATERASVDAAVPVFDGVPATGTGDRVTASLPSSAVTVDLASEEAAVRTALDRYAAATLDRGAAQRVALGECRIEVSGASASASCAGRSFQLMRGGGGWQIVSARVPNR